MHGTGLPTEKMKDVTKFESSAILCTSKYKNIESEMNELRAGKFCGPVSIQ